MCNLPRPRLGTGCRWEAADTPGPAGLGKSEAAPSRKPGNAPFFMVHQHHKQMNKGWQLEHTQNPTLDNDTESQDKRKE